MRQWVPRLLRGGVAVLLIAFLLSPNSFEPVLAPLAPPNAPAIYNQDSLLWLTVAHLGTVLVATLIATLVAVSMALLVTRPFGAEFLPLSRSIVSIGQTFPPVAVLAIAVPVFGFGEKPTLIALILYGLLPVFENALTALSHPPRAVIEAARGSGMTGWQRLVQVELPLAAPLIAAGVRLSAVIGVATATIGSTVAAKTLGEVIIAGLQTYNYAFILQGGILVAALALLVSTGLMMVERLLWRQRDDRR
ncbi:ABC transporter permease [Rhizobium sp. SAFR-030]|uniref:ABC transporter permease n=1 Tax=Rhizobium sp. SAFR-030 TaxID=3387277 RepID=UPI003F7F6A7C